MNSKNYKAWFQWLLLAGIALSIGLSVWHAANGEWTRFVSSVMWAAAYIMLYMARDTWATQIRKRWFPRKIKPYGNSMEVVIVDRDQEDLALIFGLTRERCHEITDAMKKDIPDDDGEVPEVLHVMSKHCKHPNELMYMSYVVGRQIEASQNPLVRIFANIKGMPNE